MLFIAPLTLYRRFHKEDATFFAKLRRSSQNRLQVLYVATPFMRTNGFLFSDALFIDSMHGVTEYALHLAIISVMNQHGATRMAGICIYPSESEESWTSILQLYAASCQQNGSFYRPPRVIFCDNDASIKLAARKVWPGIMLYGCFWHLLGEFRKRCVLTAALH